MMVTEAASPIAPVAAGRFYRPELDALRFFAFLAVLIHHGPGAYGIPNLIRRAAACGLSMFFLLSAYLLTELLIREREQSRTVAWGSFFVRRALRIWPLYYAALAACLVTAAIPHSALLAMSLFVVNWSPVLGSLGPAMGPLWSISVEEQFYVILAPVIKIGGKGLALAGSVFIVVLACGWIWLFSAKSWTLWYDTPVEFVFFAAGVMICLATHGTPAGRIPALSRALLLTGGVISLGIASCFGGVGGEAIPNLTRPSLYIGYGGAVAGCVAFFFAIFGISSIPAALTYLGRISYGLYVFHGLILGFTFRLTDPLGLAPIPKILVVDGTALLLCIVVAHISYKYFEMPFLKLKQRFEVVKSRPL